MSVAPEKQAPLEKTSSPGSSGAKSVTWTEDEERRIIRKLDLALLPGLTLLYLLSFLDRSNVGNAKLFNLLPDIHVTNASNYNTALALYFLGYVLFEVPAQLVLKRFNPKIWLPTLTVVWGITSTLQGLVTSRAGFYAARFFLGVSEAGLFPGCVFVFSMYYKRSERHWRVAVLLLMSRLSRLAKKVPLKDPSAGAFGGILAYGIGHIHAGSRPNWAWIFFIEGIVTVVVGLTAYWWVPGYPQHARFLSEREREIVLSRLENDTNGGDHEPFNWAGAVKAFKDPLVWGYAWLFHGFAFGLYSLSLFLPTIISQLGYANATAQLLTIPVYAVAFIGILLFAWLAHVTQLRGAWIITGGMIAIIGYIVLLTTHTPGARYVGSFLTVFGIYVAVALLLSWPSENVSPSTKRAVAGGMQIFIGDIGAIAGVLIYRPSLAANFFRKAHLIAIGYTVFGMLVAAALWFFMWRRNTKNAQSDAEKEDRLLVAKSQGDKSKNYHFQL